MFVFLGLAYLTQDDFFSNSIYWPAISIMYFFNHLALLYCVNVTRLYSLCFQVLAITINASMHIVEQVSLWYNWASFVYMAKSAITWYCDRWIPTFLTNHHMTSKVDVQVCTPTSSGGVFPLHILSNIGCP